MTLREYAAKGWLRPHTTSAREIKDLLTIVNRDLDDAAQKTLSADWRFGIAYNAALKLCTIVLHASGYRPGHGSHHMRTIAALPHILPNRTQEDADYLDACRRKRNIVEYDCAGGASHGEADELGEFARELLREVLEWLRNEHQELFT